MTTKTMFQTSDIGEAIREFRQALLDGGFFHTKRVGELQLTTGGPYDLYVRTGYATKTYRVLVFARPAGRGPRLGQHYVDYNADNWHAERLSELLDALLTWDGKSWPVNEQLMRSSVGEPGWTP